MAQTDIIILIQQDILRIQGQRPATDQFAGNVLLGPILDAFTQKVFPTGAVHECISATPAATVATADSFR